jgi:hypothetical protein
MRCLFHSCVAAPGVCGDPFQDLTDTRLASYFANTPLAPRAGETFRAGQRVSFRWTVSTAVHGDVVQLVMT